MKNFKNVVSKLIEKGFTISTMESCTGGGVCNEITNVPGASSVLLFSAITYSNSFKIKMGVDSEIIDKYRAIDEKVIVIRKGKKKQFIGIFE